MSAKVLEHLQKRLKQGEIIIDVFTAYSLSRSQKRHEITLAICTLSLYILDGSHLKRSVPIQTVRQLTLSTFSNQLVLHCSEQDLWLQSYHNVKIIKNILKIREKVLNDKTSLLVALEKQRSLQYFAAEQSKLRKFFHGVFGRKDSSSQIDRQRRSLCTLEVHQKDCVMQIARAIYRYNYKNAELLYISGSNGFIFNQFDLSRETINEQTFKFQHKETKEYFLMRRIPRCEDQQGKIIRKALQNYKLQDYNQQILFAVESAQYYQIITPYSRDQRTLQQALNDETFIPEIDLVSIFYKLVSFIRNTLHPCYSLSPGHVILKESVVLSSIFCLNASRTHVAYLAPEQLDPSLSEGSDPETINLWKIGMLLYETAFLALPFPIEYLAEVVAKRRSLTLRFPSNHGRSDSFLEFISRVLVIEPSKRGGGRGWQKNVFDHRWIIQCMK